MDTNNKIKWNGRRIRAIDYHPPTLPGLLLWGIWGADVETMDTPAEFHKILTSQDAQNFLRKGDDVTLNTLKYTSRLLGLPGSLKPLLFELLPQGSSQLKFKVCVALKYGVQHDPEFAKLKEVVGLLFQLFPLEKLGPSSSSSLSSSASQDDCVTQATIAQLMLTIVSILNPDRVQTESVEEGQLRQLENYVPHIPEKYKAQVRRCLEKMGYWSGSVTQRLGASFEAPGGNSFIQTGEEVITSIQQNRGCRVSSHVVKTQQMNAITTEENVSEKTQISNISLANALEQGRARTSEALRNRETLPPPKSATGSDWRWYLTPGRNIHNFLETAKRQLPLSPEDIEFLRSSLGFFWNYRLNIITNTKAGIHLMIGETFFRISQYQELEDTVVESILDKVLFPQQYDLKWDIYEIRKTRDYVLHAADFHCLRKKQVPEKIKDILKAFMNSSKWKDCGCQDLVRKILIKDERNLTETAKLALETLRLPSSSKESISTALNFFQSLLTSPTRTREALEESELEELKERLLSIAKINAKGETGAICSKCLGILEDLLQLQETLKLDQSDCETVREIAAIAESKPEMKLVRAVAIRLVLKFVDGALKEPEVDRTSLNNQIGFLWNLLISLAEEEDMITKVLIICMCANHFEKLDLARKDKLSQKHREFLLWALKRKDVISLEEAKYFPEEHIEEQLGPTPNEELFKYVSTYAIKILLGVCKVFAPLVNDEKTVSSVAQALLTSPSKMTKILCSEFLFNVVLQFRFTLSPQVLSDIQGSTFSPIADVRVYTTSAFCTSLANQLAQKEPLDPDYVNFLVDLYQFKKITLDKHDFTPYINPKILECFKGACQSGLDVSEHVLHLIALILNRTCADSAESPEYGKVKILLETLAFYCEDRAATLPQSVLEAVEHHLLESDLFLEECAGILEKCMGTGRWISDEVIDEFFKHVEPDLGGASVSIPFLRRLCLASENQDVDDRIFSRIQMELVALSLSVEEGIEELLQKFNFNSHAAQEKLFQSLKQFVGRGMKMSKRALDIVSGQLEQCGGSSFNFKEVVECLTLASSNGQIMPQELIAKALKQGIDADFEVQLSFANEVVQRNQPLPEELAQRVFNSLEGTGSSNWKMMELVKNMIQHDQQVPREAVRAFCRILSRNECQVNAGFLSALIRLVQRGLEKEDLETCKRIFVKAAECENLNLRETGVTGLEALPQYMQESEEVKMLISSSDLDEGETAEEGQVQGSQSPSAEAVVGVNDPSNSEEVTLTTRLQNWKENSGDGEALEELKKLLEDEKVCKEHFEEIVTTLQSVNSERWKELPKFLEVIARHVIQGKGEATAEELTFLRNEVIKGEGRISAVVLEAIAQSLKLGRKDEVGDLFLNSLADYVTTNVTSLTWQEKKSVCAIFKEAVTSGITLPTKVTNTIWRGVLNENDDALLRGECFEVLGALRERQKLNQNNWNVLFTSVLEPFYLSEIKENDFTLELLHTVMTLTYVDMERIHKTEESLWVDELLVTNTVFALGRTTDEQLELVPIAKEFCSKVKGNPQLRLYVLHSILDFAREHPGDLSVATLLHFVNSTWDDDDGKGSAGMGLNWSSECVKQAAVKGIAREICDNVLKEHPPESSDVVKMVEDFCGAGGSLEVLHRVVQVVQKSTFQVIQELVKFVGANQESVSTYLRNLRNEELTKGGGVEGLELRHSVKRDELMKVLLQDKPPSHKDNLLRQIERHLKALLKRKFSFDQLKNLLEKIRNGDDVRRLEDLEILENVLYQLVAYEVTPKRFLYLSGILQQKEVQEWVVECNKVIMEHLYSGSEGVKSWTTVYDEFIGKNSDVGAIARETFGEIIEKLQPTSGFKITKQNLKPLNDWGKSDVKNWAKMVKANDEYRAELLDKRLQEAIAVISKACVLEKGYPLSAIQVLTICMKAVERKNKGQLFQVATGSGKSTIIAAIAVLRALQGRQQVDIFTSSPVLAERDAKAWAPFYALFNLTCDHNIDKGSAYTKGPKNCYSKDIVYGDLAQFQFDVLRHEYSGLGTRGKREYHWALVDEVDSMLVDDSSKLARLSSTIPGMDLLQIMYHLIWHRLHDLQRRMLKVGPNVYYFEGVREKDENGNLVYRFMGPEGMVECVEDLPPFIVARQHDAEALERALIHKVSDIDNFVTDHLKQYTKALIGDFKFTENRKEMQKLPLPKPLVRFARSQVDNWVDSALTALVYSENVHYVVDQEQIKPVDYRSTGTIQASTNWNNGLHQFLQLKHGLKVSTETLTTNFLSNMAMFAKYGSNIVGLTGTLGSPKGQQLLREVYPVETRIIPELYYKRFHELPGRVTSSKREWLWAVVHSALHEGAKGRGVLVICETIRDAELIAEVIEQCQVGSSKKSKRGLVKLYTRNDRNEERKVEKIYEGDIIVATNLAGRGTDINTVNIEDHGGLHVILTFMPDSLRVEQQAFGRTARQGNKGTGELIMVNQAGGGAKEISDLKSARNEKERKYLEEFQEKELPVIQLKDALFSKFCKTFSGIKNELNKKRRGELGLGAGAKTTLGSCLLKTPGAGLASSALSWMEVDMLTPLEHVQLQAIEQGWAFFLKEVDDSKITPSDQDAMAKYTAKYSEFEEVVKGTFKNPDESVSRTENCFYWVQIGNEFYGRSNTFSDNTLKALKSYEEAIKVDDFGAGAEAGVAFCLLRGKSHWLKANSHKPKYKLEAIEHLHKALKISFEEMSLYTTAQTLYLHRGSGRMDSALFKSLTEKVNLLGDYCNNLQAILRTVEQSLRRVWVTQVGGGEGVEERTWKLDDYDPVSSIRTCDRSFEYTLEFHDLTAHTDLGGTEDQAVETLENGDKIGIEVSNVNLKEFAEAVGQIGGGSISRLELMRVGSVEDAMEVLEKLTPKKYTVKFWDRSQEVMKSLLEQLGAGRVIVEWEEDGVRVKSSDHRKVPQECKLVNLEVTLEKEKDLQDGWRPFWGKKVQASLILLGVERKRLRENWEVLLKQIEGPQRSEEKVPETSKSTKPEVVIETGKGRFAGIKINIPDLGFKLSPHRTGSNPNGTKEPGILQSFPRNTVTITNLKRDAAIQILKELRSKQIPFVLRMESMTLEKAIDALEKADRKSEDIEERGVKRMGEQFSSTYVPYETLRELAERGLVLMPVFSEKPPIPWKTVVVMGMIATVQVVAGGVLIFATAGLGTTVGMALVSEGISDAFTTYRITSTRQFSWTDYAIQKTVSLTISCVTVGMSGLKDCAKGEKFMAGGAGAKEVVEKAGEALAQKTVEGQSRKEVCKKWLNLGEMFTRSEGILKSAAPKYIGVKAGERVAQTGLNAVANSILDFSFDKMKPNIWAEVERAVISAFGDDGDGFKQVLSSCVAMDTRGTLLGSKLTGWTHETTQSGLWMKAWSSVVSPLVQGIFSDTQRLTSWFSTAARVIGMGAGAYQIATVTKAVCAHIRGKLENERKCLLIYVVQERCKVGSGVAEKVIKKMTFKGEAGNFEVSQFPSASDLEKHKIELLKNLFDEMKKRKEEFSLQGDQSSRLIASVVNPITDHIIQVANSMIAQPVSTFAVGWLVERYSRIIQDRFLIRDDELSIDQQRARELRKKDPAKLTPEERAFLSKQPARLTYAEILKGNAKDCSIAFHKRDIIIAILEMETPRETLSDPDSVTDKQVDAALSVLDGDPADMRIVFLLAKLKGLDVKLVDDANYEPTEEERGRGTKIIVWHKGETDNDLGHFTLQGDGEADSGASASGSSSSGKGTDCAYEVFSKLTGESVDEFRGQAASFILRNRKVFERIEEAASWIQERYPEEAQNHLHVGGRAPSPFPTNYETLTDPDKTFFTLCQDGEEMIILARQRVFKVFYRGGVGSEPVEDSELGAMVTSANAALRNRRPVRVRVKNANNKTIAELQSTNFGTLVRGHLGNAKMGTVGKDKHVAVITKSMNGKMSQHFEQRIAKFVYDAIRKGYYKPGDLLFESGCLLGEIRYLDIEEATTRVPLADDLTCWIRPHYPEHLSETQKKALKTKFEKACTYPVGQGRNSLYRKGQEDCFGATFSNRSKSRISEPTVWELPNDDPVVTYYELSDDSWDDGQPLTFSDWSESS